MAANRKRPARASSRDQVAARIAADLPDDTAALFAEGEAARRTFAAAVVAGDDQAAHDADWRYNATIWKLNGGAFFGSFGDDDAPGYQLAEHCASQPGTLPEWGQNGSFIVTANGVRALAQVWSFMGRLTQISVEFRAIDRDRPFISPTGYRHHFFMAVRGLTLSDAIHHEFNGLISACGLVPITNPGRRELPKWCRDLPPLDPREAFRTEQDGQIGFGF